MHAVFHREGVGPGIPLLTGEVKILVEHAPMSMEKEVEVDEGVVIQLVSRVFNMEGCRRAVDSTHNQGVAHAMN